MSSQGQAGTLIRDAEIEDTIAMFAKPVFEVAGLPNDGVQIYLVKDNRLNAFVAGGMNIFLHTGLLQKSKTPEQLIGVIAHETGHIAGGHLARIRERMKGVSAESILGYVLGGAAVLAGQPGAGSAIIVGGQDMAQRGLLNYTRGHEGAADQAALNYLDRMEITSRGLLEFFEIMKDQELVSSQDQNPYIRSHPLTSERIVAMKAHVENSAFKDNRVPDLWIERHARMRAKLDAFMFPIEHTLRIYPEIDKSLSARYARAMGYHEAGQMNKAVSELASLIEDRPQDPYFHELLGEVYFENAYITEAISAFETANSLAPNTPLIEVQLARAFLATEDPQTYPRAIELLERSVQEERTSGFFWRQLAIAYGKSDRMAESSVALAEEAYLQRRYEDAIFLAERGQKDLKEGSHLWLRAEDIRLAAERLQKKAGK